MGEGDIALHKAGFAIAKIIMPGADEAIVKLFAFDLIDIVEEVLSPMLQRQGVIPGEIGEIGVNCRTLRTSSSTGLPSSSNTGLPSSSKAGAN